MKRISSILLLVVFSIIVFAQNTPLRAVQAENTSASIIKVTPVPAETFTTHELLHRVPVVALPQHNSAYAASIALLVLGPVKMAVGIGVGAWVIAASANHTLEGKGVGYGAALGGFHLLTGAALTAGGAVLLKKSRNQTTGNVYMTLPQMAMRAEQKNITGLSMRTSIVF